MTQLEVQTPKLTLRYITDELAEDLAHVAAEGVHDPATTPFRQPWSDVPPPQLRLDTLRFIWKCRAEMTVQYWDLCLAVVADGVTAGVCHIHAEEFPARRTATTGAWLGQRFQRQGIGLEMRQAALHLIFAGLGAERALTNAWHDNVASLGVTRRLPYTETGTSTDLRRGKPDTLIEFEMTAERWNTIRRNDIHLVGISATRKQLSLEQP